MKKSKRITKEKNAEESAGYLWSNGMPLSCSYEDLEEMGEYYVPETYTDPCTGEERTIDGQLWEETK